ncbi:MAG: CoA-binding protein [Chloroflexota bacterium]
MDDADRAPRPDDEAAERARRRADRERVRALMDLHEGRGPVPVLDDAAIADVLGRARRIAVVGASSRPFRPSHGVMAELLRHGYDVVPVSPRETEVLGRRCYPDLAAAVAAEGPVDIVDVFRNAAACPAHARESVEVGAGCLWLQLGIVSWEAARIAAEAGIPVVMDRCTSIELGRLRPGRSPQPPPG